MSSQITCACGAATTPTQSTTGKEIVYRIYSFGCNAGSFPSCQRLHESKLDLAVQALEDGVLVAVRVGSDPQRAILIKDANGGIRSSAQTEGSSLRQDISKAEFLRVSRETLESHADKTAGKVLLTT